MKKSLILACILVGGAGVVSAQTAKHSLSKILISQPIERDFKAEAAYKLKLMASAELQAKQKEIDEKMLRSTSDAPATPAMRKGNN